MPSAAVHAQKTDLQQRQLLVVLALLSVLVQGLTLGYMVMEAQPSPRFTPVVFGLLLSVLVSVLTSTPRLAVAVIQRGVVALLTGWLLLNLLSVMVTHRPITSGLLLHTVVLSLLAFSWLPLRWAAIVACPTYLFVSLRQRVHVA
ncbi:hypothetical protein ACFSC4_31525 [Deinococcus malanensis]|uniref:hypothetical protein n=1 Tax=Deinococcus malanensis TaxID=1706855 RepID=UPI0036269C09